MNKVSLLILAGGMGSRYKGQKQIDIVSGEDETLMEFALFDALKVGIRKFVFIINNQFPESYQSKIKDILAHHESEVHFIEQTLEKYIPEKHLSKINLRTKPLGTAHAVYCAKAVIKEPFITMNADDFYGYQTFEMAYDFIASGQIDAQNYGMCVFELNNTLSENGSVSRGICQVDHRYLQHVEEFTKIEKKDDIIIGLDESLKQQFLKGYEQVSMNFWLLHPSFFKMIHRDLDEFLDNYKIGSNAEFYLPSVNDKGIQNKVIKAQVLTTSEKWFGLTYPGDKEQVVQALEDKKNQGKYPSSLWKV